MTNTSAAPPMGPHRYAGKVVTHAMGMRGAKQQDFASVMPKDHDFRRADIIVEGVDHSGPSFDVRLFGNNPEANVETAPTAENGYLGEFHIFAHGFCFGDVGHCEVNDRGQSETDLRDPHPLTPQRKIVVVTEGLKALLKRDGALRQVTLVPIAIGSMPKGMDPEKARDVLKYKSLRVLTYK